LLSLLNEFIQIHYYIGSSKFKIKIIINQKKIKLNNLLKVLLTLTFFTSREKISGKTLDESILSKTN